MKIQTTKIVKLGDIVQGTETPIAAEINMYNMDELEMVVLSQKTVSYLSFNESLEFEVKINQVLVNNTDLTGPLQVKFSNRSNHLEIRTVTADNPAQDSYLHYFYYGEKIYYQKTKLEERWNVMPVRLNSN